jgi:hypothetical protein
MVDQSDYTT